MYSSTTCRRISRWRPVSSERSITMAFAGDFSRSSEQLRGHAAAEKASARRQRELVFVAFDEAQVGQARDRRRVQEALLTIQRERLVESQAQHHPLAAADVGVELLDFPVGPGTGGERLEVRGQARRVSPAPRVDRRDGADADPEIVAPEPVGEVVPGPEVTRTVLAEVGRLVPPVAGSREPLDDGLEVPLHQVGLTDELFAVCVREPGSGLRLQLVAREVLRPELECLVDVGVEVGGALARDPVDEIEGDVVKSGTTEMVESAPDVAGAGNAVEDRQQPRLKRLDAERDAVDTAVP